jgi:hypothetical protein
MNRDRTLIFLMFLMFWILFLQLKYEMELSKIYQQEIYTDIFKVLNSQVVIAFLVRLLTSIPQFV